MSGVDDTVDRQGGDSSSSVRCDTCGSTLDLRTWTPAAFESDESGKTVLYRFCDNQCRKEWVQDDSD